MSKVNIGLHILIYGSLFLCNEIHEYNLLFYFAGFWIGAADSSMMTQIQILTATYFSHPAQVFAILNIIKTCSMGLIILLGSVLTSKEAFRWYFLFQIVINVANQVYVLLNFQFEKKVINSLILNGGKEEREESELQKL